MPFSMSGRTVGLISLILFILTIPAGNWVVMNVGTVCPPDSPCLIPVWPGIMSPSAVLFAGLALILRDAVQSLLGKADAEQISHGTSVRSDISQLKEEISRFA